MRFAVGVSYGSAMQWSNVLLRGVGGDAAAAGVCVVAVVASEGLCCCVGLYRAVVRW